MMIQKQSKLYTCLLFVGIVMLCLQLTSCERNRCITRGTVCLNNGTCNDGNCICPAEFEGDSCQFATNKKYAGRYEGILLFVDSFRIFSDTITVGQTAGSNLKINWIHDVIKNAIIKGNVAGNSIVIPPTTCANGYTYQGKGSLNKDICTLSMRDDSIVGGSSFKKHQFTFAGNRIK
jgi:hypothetical protein